MISDKTMENLKDVEDTIRFLNDIIGKAQIFQLICSGPAAEGGLQGWLAEELMGVYAIKIEAAEAAKARIREGMTAKILDQNERNN